MKARTTKEWQQTDAAHYLHPFSDYKSLAKKGSRIITRADGVYIYDADGHQILDGMSGLWCVNLGYGRRELIDAATAQMRELPFYNSFFQCTHPPAIRLAELLSEIAQPQLNHAFFTGSGSEANDTVIRMVRHYWAVRGEPKRDVIVSRVNAYHGSTVGSASLGGMAAQHAQGGLPIPGVEHIAQPYYFEHKGNLSADEFGIACARELERRIEKIGPDRIAAFIGEPVQGAGGVIIPPDSYWPEIRRICERFGILLVVDEVITGFGRLGAWFGADRYRLAPDLMPMAKGMSSGYLPIGGVMVSDRVAATLAEGGEFFHGFTYSGHPTCAAVAIKAIEILRDEGIVERVRDDLAPYLAARWASLAEHPIVGEARTCGLVGALELVADKRTKARWEPKGRAGETARDLAVKNGVVMRHVNESLIIAPPLVITHAQIDELVEKAHKTLDDTQKALRAA
jgi:putrescine---pyruvate transaminase